MKLGIFSPKLIRGVEVNFKNLVIVKLFPDRGQIRAGFSDGLPAPGAFEKEKSPQRKNIYVNELKLIFYFCNKVPKTFIVTKFGNFRFFYLA